MPDVITDAAMLQGEHEGQTFDGLVADKVELTGAEFSRCAFRNCSFQYASFADCGFERCSFDCCNLTLARLEGARLLDVNFANSKLSGVNWSNTSGIFRASYSDCLMDNCSFTGLNLSRYVFTDCSFRDAIFQDNKLAHATFAGCDLLRCTFHNTDLSFADFSTASNYFMNAETNRLHKTVFSLPEAASLLGNLDITLK
jgi:uncharacterized protein YjbI with pentapeptide repeats